MQGEIPPQAEMRIGGVGGFIPYAATASLVASAMGAPPDMQVFTAPLLLICTHLRPCLAIMHANDDAVHRAAACPA